MPTATALLNVCRSQIGYREGRRNANRYGAWYGMDNVPYCAIGLMWAAAHCGAPRLFGGRYAYCPTWVALARRAGVWHDWHQTPQPGDIVFFDWTGSHRLAMHVGIVERVEGGVLVTIEFNTLKGAGNQSDGGGVFRRRRSTGFVVGYARPPYSRQGPPTPIASSRIPLVVDGVWGPKTTVALQAWLGQVPTGVLSKTTRTGLQHVLHVTEDGSWGPVTHKALQRMLHVTQDGDWGPQTIKALQAFLNRTV